jgi:SAM-dependent methyltransferase
VTAPDPYASIAEYYDQEHAGLTDDVEMYLQFIRAAGDPVLELGCGTGRVLLPIARAGFQVTGVDSSESMLTRARRAIQKERLEDRACLLRQEMVTLGDLPTGVFGVAILALDSLLHLASQEGQLSALKTAFDALDPRGQLIIDMMNPTPHRLDQMFGQFEFAATWEVASGEIVDKTVSRLSHPADQLIQIELWYDKSTLRGPVRRTRSSFTQRWVSPGELTLMLRIAGFQDSRVYGNYDLEPLTDFSDRLIVAAEKSKTV